MEYTLARFLFAGDFFSKLLSVVPENHGPQTFQQKTKVLPSVKDRTVHSAKDGVCTLPLSPS